MRTSIKQDGCAYVTVSTDCQYVEGNRIMTTYFVASGSDGSGYVKTTDNGYPQVCDGLRRTGSTLRATPDTLLSVIRVEYHKGRRQDKKERN